MDPRVAGAGVAVAVAMLMLLPTFNALNNSYDMSVPPPDWMPMPDEIPENFEPPEDMDYPEGWEPPPNMTPPPGWEPPPGYEGPVPPGGCPPPVFVPAEEWNRDVPLNAAPSATYSWDIELPEYTVGFGGFINVTNWRASSVSYTISDQNGTIFSDSQPGTGNGLLGPGSATPETSWQVDSREEWPDGFPPPGTYTLTINVQLPVDGAIHTEFIYALPCGGLLQ